MAESLIKKSFTKIVSITKVAETVTTGVTGNISTPFVNTGYIGIFSPYTFPNDYYVRAWVSSANNHWFLTVINPNTGATINNTSVGIRYWAVEFSTVEV